MHFMENVKFLRKLNHLSQRAFDKLIFPFYAEDTFVTCKLENGKYRNPLPYLICVANFFQVSLDKLTYTLITESDLNMVQKQRNIDCFYLNFNKLRKRKNIPFKTLAQKSGISINTIINYSRDDKCYFIKLDNLYSISRILGSSLDKLLSNSDDDIIPK